MNLLHHSKEAGSLNILDIKSRNEAIDLMWLKTYLDFSPNHPPWAAIMDLSSSMQQPQGQLLYKQGKTPSYSVGTPLQEDPAMSPLMMTSAAC
jgi:hypothetical protein